MYILCSAVLFMLVVRERHQVYFGHSFKVFVSCWPLDKSVSKSMNHDSVGFQSKASQMSADE
jgi:hypothetical protein